jgi:hypothetical protein
MGTGHLTRLIAGTMPAGWCARLAPAAMLAMAVMLNPVPGRTAPAPAPTVTRLGLNELAGQSTIICLCHMTDQRSEWDGEKNMLVTVVTLQGEEYFKGAGKPGDELAVELFSGFGHEQLNIFGTVFEQGERVVVFLAPAGDAAAKHYHIVGWAQGKFTVRTDPKTGEERVDRHLEGIHFSPPKPGETVGATPQTLNELRAAIRAAVTPPGGVTPAP